MTYEEATILPAELIDELLACGPSGARELGRRAAALEMSADRLLDELRAAGWTLNRIDAAGLQAMLGALRSEFVEPVCDAETDALGLSILRLLLRRQIESTAPDPGRLDDVLASAMEMIARSFECDACTLFLHDSARHTLTLTATYGLDPELAGNFVIRDDAGITGHCAVTRETQMAPVAQEHPCYLPYPPHVDSRMTSHMSVPVLSLVSDKLLGVLNLQNLDFKPFTARDKERAESIARDLALAIETGHRQHRNDAVLAQRLSDVETLHTLTQALSGTLMQDELEELGAKYAAQLVGASTAAVYRCNDQHEFVSITPYTETGEDFAFDDDCRAVARETCETRVARAQRIYGDDGPLVYAAALVARSHLLGVVVARIDSPTLPGPGQLSLFQAFADTVAMGLSNAELYDESIRAAATSSALLQEMHHRVRNNLQIVASLLSLQARAASNPAVTGPLHEAVARIQSIASIHDLMSQSNVEFASLQTIAEMVANEASINVVPPGKMVRFDIDTGDINIPTRHAMVLGLLINECVTNAIIHGFADREAGTIRIESMRHNGIVELTITDDGVGLPKFGEDSPTSSTRLGTRIAARIAESDLRGSFALEPAEPRGTTARITFPLPRVGQK